MGPHLVRDGAQVDEAASVRGWDLRALRSGEAGGEKESGGDDVICKALEIRDEGTFIPALAVDMNPSVLQLIAEQEGQRYLLRRCGYPCDGEPNVILTRLDGNGKATNDPYEWGGRTWPVAHHYIIDHWNDLKDGDVVDVQFILGETDKPKVSERERVTA